MRTRKPTAAQRRAATDALDAWVLGIAAKVARESLPDDEDAAFSAFLSEVAGDRYLSGMRIARGLVGGARGRG